ncbi:trichoplein keratin filament-binding protein-like [Oryzias melastigma]|uniref:trichoplein keratin filament-binding protein-like n=1 Tax=Oryzias melastigma TaxID=30732 RepID=UPI00168CE142|nr:trichoplein keratin filament-binding protein-like [Oryzias melastigma]
MEKNNSDLRQEMAQRRKDRMLLYAIHDKGDKEVTEKMEEVKRLAVQWQHTSKQKVNKINHLEGTSEEKLDQLKQQVDKLEKQHQMGILEITSKIFELENSLKKDKTRANEAENCSTQKVAISVQIKPVLEQTLQQQKKQLEKEENSLISDNQLALSKERKEWETKNSDLSQEMAEMRKDRKLLYTIFDKADKDFTEKIAEVRELAVQQHHTIKQKDNKINNLEGALEENLDKQKQQMKSVEETHRLQHWQETKILGLTSKIFKLKNSLKEEKTRAKEAEICLARQVVELVLTKAVLVETERNLQQQKEQLEKEKNCLINDHQLALSKERQEWETKISHLLREMAQMRKEQQERSATFEKSEKDFSEKFGQAQKQIEQLQETIAEKVSIINNFDGVLEEKLDQQKQKMDKLENQHQMEILDFSSKLEKLENSLKEEKARGCEAENCLAQQVVELVLTKAVLVETERNLQQQNKQLEKENNCLINDHQLALSKERKQLAKERQEWETKNSHLSHEMAQMRKEQQERSATFEKSEKDFSEKFGQAQKQIEQLQETIAEKVSTINNFDGVLEEKLDQQKQKIHKLENQHQMEILDFSSKLEKLENSLKEEKARGYKAENCLAQRVVELVQVKAVLVETERNLQQQKEQLEKKTDWLINDYQLALLKERKQLQDTIAEKVSIINNFDGVLEEKLDQQRQQMEIAKEDYRQKNCDFFLQVSQLEAELQQERDEKNRVKHSFELEARESANLRAALFCVEKDLEYQKQQWETELLNVHQPTTSALAETQKQLEQERVERQEEKEALLQQTDNLKQVVKTLKTNAQKTATVNRKKIKRLQLQVEQLRKTKTKRTSFRRRFVNLFRRVPYTSMN